MNELNHYLRPRPRHRGLALAACGVLLAFGIVLGMDGYRQHQLAQASQQRIERIRAEQALKPPVKLKPSEQEDQKRWAALKVERGFNWTPLFAAIERASSPDIELLEFQPEKESLRILLQGEARNQQALTAFLEALAQQQVFRNVHLTHQQKKTRDRLETVEFEIHAAISLM
jgi:hypothetical protein